MVSSGHTMATAITSAPSAPTSIPKAKAFVGNVGDKVLWITTALLAVGAVKVFVLPLISRVPVAGRLVGASGSGAAFDEFGTMLGA